MREPGASEVLMCGCTFRPASTAFLASRPAASSTLGLRGVGAAGDGGDQHVAVADGDGRRPRGRGRLGLARRRSVGWLPAISTTVARRAGRRRAAPRRHVVLGRRLRCTTGGACASFAAGWLKPFSAVGLLNSAVNCVFDVAELDAVLRPLRAGQAGRHGAEVELDDLRVVDLAGQRHAEQPLRLEVGLEGLDLGLACGRCP